MRKKIVEWLRVKVRQAKAKGIVLGLSGGVDSSVVAALAKEAVGRKKILGLFLPCHSQKQDLQDARLVAGKLGIATRLIDISKVYAALVKMLPSADLITRSNLKPRLRMLVLYYFANKLNYLVCGTGNKSELMAGYFTKHGDGATDILPIAGLLKRQVVKLAKELDIPERIINKPPSAGLWQGQTDEGEMGITYAELDNILERIQSRKKQLHISNKVRKVKAMIKKSEHKRKGPEVCCLLK